MRSASPSPTAPARCWIRSASVDDGDAIGVVGRNGDGKTTLLKVLAGMQSPDHGRVTHTAGLSVGYLRQTDDFAAEATVRELIVGGRPDHVWARDPDTRAVVEHLLSGVDLDAVVGTLSGGERRRVALVAVLLAGHRVLMLDEPTNHLDVEAIGWLAGHLAARRTQALVVVSHDRWFLDEVCTRTWEVHDGGVDGYDGGYAAYVLARAERMRVAAGRGAAAQPDAQGAGLAAARPAGSHLQAEVPHPGGQRADRRRAPASGFSCAATLCHQPIGKGRLRPARGCSSTLADRTVLRDVDWSIGPGARIGLVGVNGTGKTSVLRLLDGELHADCWDRQARQDAPDRPLDPGARRVDRRAIACWTRSRTAGGWPASPAAVRSVRRRCWRTSGSPATS